MSRWFSFTSVSALLLLPLAGHDLYLLPDHFTYGPDATMQVSFHNGDSFPDSEVAPRPERLKDALWHSSAGNGNIVGLHVNGKESLGTARAVGTGALLLSVRTDPNFIELPADKFTAYLREEGLTQVLSWRNQHRQSVKPGRERYQKFAESLVLVGAPNDLYKRTLGLPIEIVPLSNPYELHAGARLPVQVLFQGKPAPDLQLEAAWAGESGKKVQVIGRTDANGKIEVPVAQSGKWRLHTLIMNRCAEPKVADWESYWASLTFAVR